MKRKSFIFVSIAAALLASPLFASGPAAVKLFIGPKEISAEVAQTQRQREKGLMGRSSLADDEGMLFVYDMPQQVAFYMKDTFVPLSCAFLDERGVILEIRDLEPLDETAVLSSSLEVRFVVEAKRGWFEKNGIVPGDKVLTEKGSLLSLF